MFLTPLYDIIVITFYDFDGRTVINEGTGCGALGLISGRTNLGNEQELVGVDLVALVLIIQAVP